ncbi:MAG TPA: asparagine synthase (glutamine-hydrolyzing) [Trueperaceae bacterium]|nr:asparagine synthase (glutamine-hydrolyzing) [Trueperaceae bacterium]
MCGICGAWGSELTGGAALLEPALRAIEHRGPDGQGVHAEPGVALGMRRLSIIDVEGGQQPVWNETRDVCVVLNGEVYNYLELFEACRANGHELRTRSDTEAIVHLYEDDPEGFATRLRGMFALALFDRRRGRLVLARDRFGKKPLYYTTTPSNVLLFASELKALVPLMRAHGMAPCVEPQAIYDYLSLGSVPQPTTIYRGVCALPPGHLLVADDEGRRVQEYWRPRFEPSFAGSYEEAQAAVRAKVREAVRLRLRSDVPLGTFLSAGVDSSIVTHEAAQEVGEGLRTFTVASEDPALDESGVAAASAARLGVENTVLHLDIDPLHDLDHLVRVYDQPFADPSAIPSLRVSRAAREHVKVVLNGDGGDELFGGYRRHVAAQALAGMGWVPRPVAGNLARLLSPARHTRRSPLGLAGRMLRGLAASDAERYLTWTSDMLLDADKRPAWRGAMRPTEELVGAHIDPRLRGLDQQVAADLRLNLLSSLLVKMDMATSANSLEGRSPLLDHELAELALRLPANYRVREGRPKAILRDAYAGVLNPEVVTGKKRGFEVPLATWLAGPWRELLHDTLGAPDARTLAFVDGALLRRVLEPESFRDRNKAYVSYSFLVLELWLRSIEA